MPNATKALRAGGVIYSELGFDRAKELLDDLVSRNVLEYPKGADGSQLADKGGQPLISVAPAYRQAPAAGTATAAKAATRPGTASHGAPTATPTPATPAPAPAGTATHTAAPQSEDEFFATVRTLPAYAVKPDAQTQQALPSPDRFPACLQATPRQNELVAQTLGPDARRLLADSYRRATAADAIRMFEGKVVIPVYRADFTAAHFTELSIKQGHDQRGRAAWYFSHIEPNAPRTVAPRRKSSLETFAYMGVWDVTLSTLATKALPEPWSFTSGGRLSILRNYLDNTFRTLQDQNKVLQTANVAAFDTGLYDRLYRSIHAVFIPNPVQGAQPWKFADWAVAGQSTRTSNWGKRLLDEFPALPEHATYFESIDDMLYDTGRRLYPDIDHILRDNVARLTRDFVQRCTRGDQRIMDLYDEYHALPEQEPTTERGRTIAHSLGDLVTAGDRIHMDIYDELRKAIDVTLRRITTDFRIAVPAYNPTKRQHMFLLPLSLQPDASGIDVVLVATLTGSRTSYQAQTILTNWMAYTDARLVSRIDTTWLPAAAGL